MEYERECDYCGKFADRFHLCAICSVEACAECSGGMGTAHFDCEEQEGE